MRQRVFASALLAMVLAACGGDGRITEPTSASKVRVLAAIGTDPVTGATIETNLDDYQPGGTVSLVGRGWAPNETVHLVMIEDPDTHADISRDIQADGTGAFSVEFYVVDESDLGVTFTLTATGTTSGSVAVATFTDGTISNGLIAMRDDPTCASAQPSVPAGTLICAHSSFTVSGSGSTNVQIRWKSPANTIVQISQSPSFPNGTSGTQTFDPRFTPTTAGTWTVLLCEGNNSDLAPGGAAQCQSGMQRATQTFVVTAAPANTAPVVSAGADATVNEGATFTQNGSFTDPDVGNSWSATVDYGDGSGVQALTLSGKNFSLSHVYTDNGLFTVTVTVNDGTTSASDQVPVTVNNVAPTATFTAPSSVAGGVPFSISLTAPSDPSSVDQAAGFTYAFDCGSGYAAFSGMNTASCPGAVPTSVTVKGTIKDKDGGVTEYTTSVAVDNVAPLAGAGGPYSGNEASAIPLLGTGSDPDGGAVTFEWSTNAPPSTCTIAPPANAQNASVTCNDNGSWTVSLKVTDNELASTTSNVALDVANVAPIIGAKTAGANVDEGSMIAFAVSNVTDVSSADQNAGFMYAFACDGVNFGSYGGSSTVNCPAGDGPGSVSIAAKAKDKDGGESAVVSSTFTVVNVPPTVDAGIATASLNEGSTFSRSGSFSDPGPDTWSATVDYGDGSGAVALALTAAKTFSLSHAYANDGVFTITVTVSDDDGASSDDKITVTVNNVLPIVNAGAGGTINEAGTFSGSGSFTDPGADSWTATVNYGDGSVTVPLALTGKGFTLSHTYTDDTNGPFTVTVTVNDDDGFGSGTAMVIVNNVVPVITLPLNIPVNPIPAGTPLTLTWNFTDPGADTWQCKISWDLPSVPGPIVFDAPFNSSGKSCSATKTLAAGIYTITVHVADDDGGYDQETATAYIVVYDPNAGFVTGGGWINSIPGAYVADPELTGKANFGFVSKYKKGQTLPDGNTEFQFHAGNLNFKSDAYEWLVVAGPKAQFKGIGTINGQGKYGFILTATDGQVSGGGGVDKFRMKIWIVNADNTEGPVVYDNQMGAVVDANPATSLGGGSINIQAK